MQRIPELPPRKAPPMPITLGFTFVGSVENSEFKIYRNEATLRFHAVSFTTVGIDTPALYLLSPPPDEGGVLYGLDGAAYVSPGCSSEADIREVVRSFAEWTTELWRDLVCDAGDIAPFRTASTVS